VANRLATTSFTGLSGSRPAALPAVTATTTCTVKAPTAPIHTQPGLR